MTEIRLSSVGIVARFSLAWSLLFNSLRVLVFGEAVIRFTKVGDDEDIGGM